MEANLSPEQAVFRAHLAGGRFLSGVAAGRWRAVFVAWPYAVFGVRAADGAEYGLRFECNDYPRTAATARPWDIEKDAPLADGMWPGGGPCIALAFNPSWKNGACLYLPCDQQSIEGHTNWLNEHPSLLWDPALGVVHYLRIVYDLLNCSEYGGRRAA